MKEMYGFPQFVCDSCLELFKNCLFEQQRNNTYMYDIQLSGSQRKLKMLVL
jgi:hypothetical protein